MPKLSTWLVVALTGCAMAVGVTAGVLVAGGGSARHSTSSSSTLSARAPAAVRTVSTAGRTPPAPGTISTVSTPSAPVRTVSTAARTPGAAPAPSHAKVVPLPEANPLAVGAPPTTAPAPPPAASPVNVAAPAAVAPAPSGSGEPVEVEPGARRASIGAALNALQAVAANSGEAVQNVAHELCLELVRTPLPSAGGGSEQLPFSCEAN